MKKVLASVLIVLGLASTVMAFPDATEMQENYYACGQFDETWMTRFGQYLVSFDLAEASDICNAADPSVSGPAQVMACRFNGQWLYAGYYCSGPMTLACTSTSPK